MQLKKHLAPLQRQGRITIWSDMDLNAGVEWERELHEHLESADIILLLVSPDFMDSDYCYGTEMMRALARHSEGDVAVIPILLRPAFWRDAPFARLQITPVQAKPVTNWPDRDNAFYHITKCIDWVISVFPSPYSFTKGEVDLTLDNGYAGVVIHEQQAIRSLDAKSRQEARVQRKQFCVPILVSIHELAPFMAELRKAHDDLWARQKLLSQAGSYAKRVNALFKTFHERSAVAGSELSIDLAGREVMEALTAYYMAQDEYVQAMLQPLRKVHTSFFGKTDIQLLDGLAEKANEKLTALEEAIRLYVDSP